MDPKRFVIGTLVGAAVLVGCGYFIVALPFGNFYAYAMNAGSATGVPRDPPLLWAVAVAELAYGALLTLAIERTGAPTAAGGVKVGAVVGFLAWFTADFMLYGISHVGNLTTALVDPLVETVLSAVAGGAIALVLGRIR